MIVSTFTCDRCGDSWDTDERQPNGSRRQQWSVTLGFRDVSDGDSGNRFTVDPEKAQWCRPCLEHFGLVPRKPRSDGAEYEEPPSFVELVRAIVREEVEQ